MSKQPHEQHCCSAASSSHAAGALPLSRAVPLTCLCSRGPTPGEAGPPSSSWMFRMHRPLASQPLQHVRMSDAGCRVSLSLPLSRERLVGGTMLKEAEKRKRFWAFLWPRSEFLTEALSCRRPSQQVRALRLNSD